jgi:cytochrome c nitrite reductase small subunit
VRRRHARRPSAIEERSVRIERTSSAFAGGLLGLAAGLAGYTFLYARGASYLTNDPAACANCHIMRPYLDAWVKSSHRAAAVCNDCHTPDGFFAKYASKASNGFWHSFAFTSGRYPEPLRIKPHNHEITERACRRCHGPIVEAVDGPHARVESIQERTFRMRNLAMDALVALVGDIKAAKAAGASEVDLAGPREMHRKAQFFLDFVEAENSTGFHAPQEAVRILGESIDFARKGQVALRDGTRAARAPAP